MMRISANEFGESCSRADRIIEIVAVDLADGHQGFESVTAAGIFTAQEFILIDG